MSTLSAVRKSVLLGVLIVVGYNAAQQALQTRSWDQPLGATIYPINADGTETTARYIERLDNSDFKMINEWGVREAARYDLALRTPLLVKLGETVNSIPPAFPEEASSLSTLIWGLKFRWWAYKNTPKSHDGLTQVRLFVMYYEGVDNQKLAHSLGMQKGLMGLVHVFSDRLQNAQNNIVIAHELLHTVGATDKYDGRGHPIFPVGYANENRTPLYPQSRAEVMAGRIPLSHNRSEMAKSLRTVQINEHTARDINWITDKPVIAQ